ncbi:MAG: hypothetical protein GY710_26625 [Desulfobacteraceae bacterium]|nr:hypothetical protein [Desulfobacteraceae bacterium]
MLYENRVKDILDIASYACENIIQAARDISMAKKDVFPAEVFVDGKKIQGITEFDIFRRKLDLDHFQVSRKWLSQIDENKRNKLKKKLSYGLQSIVWFTGLGCPYFSYSECCQAIDDALKLINSDYKKTSGALLDPQLLAERIIEDPRKIITILEQVQSSIRGSSTVKDERDAIIETWFQTDFCNVIRWDECFAVGPAAIDMKTF